MDEVLLTPLSTLAGADPAASTARNYYLNNYQFRAIEGSYPDLCYDGFVRVDGQTSLQEVIPPLTDLQTVFELPTKRESFQWKQRQSDSGNVFLYTGVLVRDRLSRVLLLSRNLSGGGRVNTPLLQGNIALSPAGVLQRRLNCSNIDLDQLHPTFEGLGFKVYNGVKSLIAVHGVQVDDLSMWSGFGNNIAVPTDYSELCTLFEGCIQQGARDKMFDLGVLKALK